VARNQRKKSERRAGPYRTCAGCRKRLPSGATVRLVLGPHGRLLPDLYSKLPGRGVHLCPDFACFKKAAENNSFSRSLRAPARIDDPRELFDTVLDSSRDQVRAILSTAARSGWLLAGRTNVKNALNDKKLALVMLATDASQSLRREIVASASSGNIPCRILLTVADLSRFNRGKPLAVLGIRHRGLARRLEREVSKTCAMTISIDPTQNHLATARHGHLTAPPVRGKMHKRNSGASGARS
jgi:predicted RNA-binding protein YlxR (DUF448 family)